MKIVFFTGILLLFLNGLCECNGDQKWLILSQSQKNPLQVLCRLFPKALQEKCISQLNSKNYSDQSEGVSIVADIKIQLNLNGDLEDPKKTCQICIKVVKFYESIINKSLSAVDIQKAIISNCGLLKEPYKDTCEVFYHGVGFKLIKAILASENPEKICQMIRLCEHDSDLNHHHIFMDLLMTGHRKNYTPCQVCTAYITYVERVIDTSKTPKEVIDTVSATCNIFIDNFKILCHDYYNGIGALAIKAILKKEDPNKICTALRYCNNTTPVSGLEMKSLELIKPHVNCKLCQRHVAKLEKVIRKSMKPAEFQGRLFHICRIYKNPLRDRCITFYKGVGFEILKALLESKSPKEICQIAKICAKMTENEDHLKFLDQLVDAFEEGKGSKCKECVGRISSLEKHIDTSKSAVNIQKKILKYCGVYKERISVYCKYFFYTKGFHMIKEVLKQKCPVKICQEVHFCPKKAELIGKTTDSSQRCDMCVLVVTYYEATVNKSLSASYIQKILLDICNIYKSPLNNQCKTFYQGLGLQVIKAILAGQDKISVCQIMNVCRNSSSSNNNQIFLDLMLMSVKKDSIPCRYCSAYMEYQEHIIDTSKTTQEVVHTVAKSCNIFINVFNYQCQIYYIGLGRLLINAILHQENPHRICVGLGYCSARVTDEKPTKMLPLQDPQQLEIIKSDNTNGNKVAQVCSILKSPLKEYCTSFMKIHGDKLISMLSGKKNDKETAISKAKSNPLECYLCKEIMKELEKILVDKHSKKEIKEALERVCGLVHNDLKRECQNFVDMYADKIIDLLVQSFTTNEICKYLQVCSKEQEDNLYYLPSIKYN